MRITGDNTHSTILKLGMKTLALCKNYSSIHKEGYMETIPTVFNYLLIGSTATVCGILYWMAMENMREQRFRTFYIFTLSFLLPPVGAWVVSVILRLNAFTSKKQ
jgi:hypothetical protein